MVAPVSHVKKYSSDYQYYRNATTSIVTAIAIGALVLLHLNKWNVERCIIKCKLFVTDFFATDLIYKVSIVSSATLVLIASPYGTAAILIYKRDHLKMTHLSLIESQKEEDADAVAKANKLLKAIASHNSSIFNINTSILKNELKQLKADHASTFERLLNALAEMMISDPDVIDPKKAIDKLSKIIDWEEDPTLNNVHSMVEDAKNYFLQMDNKHKISFLRYLCKLKDALLVSLGNIIGMLGVVDLGEPTDNPTQQSLKGQKLFVLVTILQVLTTILVQSLGGPQGGIAVASVFGGIVGVSALWPYIRPLPSALPGGAINLTQKIEDGEESIYESRAGVSEQMADLLGQKKHVMITGPSRTGKTLTVKAFVGELILGKFPELQGKTVFYWNMADLIQDPGMAGGNKLTIFKRIEEEIGRHKDDVILVFDEFQVVCTEENRSIAEGLKSYFDENGKFKRVIGITTDAEYKQYVVKNDALAKRFTCVGVTSTELDETRTISKKLLLEEKVPFTCSDELLTYIIERCKYEKTEDGDDDDKKPLPQPFTAITVLKDCIQQARNELNLQEQQNAFNATKNKIKNLESDKALENGRSSQLHQQHEKELTRLQTEQVHDGKTLEEWNQDLSRKHLLREQLLRAEKFRGQCTVARHKGILKDKKITTSFHGLACFEKQLQKKITEKFAALEIGSEIKKDFAEKALQNLHDRIKERRNARAA